jgi:hypothetical protein
MVAGHRQNCLHPRKRLRIVRNVTNTPMKNHQIEILVKHEALVYRAYRDACQKGAADKEWATWMAVSALVDGLQLTMTQKERELLSDYRDTHSAEFGCN